MSALAIPQKPHIALREAKRSAAMDLTPISEAKPLQKPKALSDDEEQIAELMVYGLSMDHEMRGTLIKAGWPLTLEQAAIYVGYRAKRARNHLDNVPEFQAHRQKMLDQRRKSEQSRNLVTAIDIRDDEGDGSAATKTVRLKAIQVIEGTSDKARVTVNVNQQTNVATIQPGYVIRLPAGAPMPLTIDQEPEPITIEANQ